MIREAKKKKGKKKGVSTPHSEHYVHLKLKNCPEGDSCAKLDDPEHRVAYHHKGYPDFLKPCPDKICLKTNDKKHCTEFQHSIPYQIPILK